MQKKIVQFKGSQKLNQLFRHLYTFNAFFRHFVDDNLIALIVEQSNFYSTRTISNPPATLTELVNKRYIDISISMSMSPHFSDKTKVVPKTRYE